MSISKHGKGYRAIVYNPMTGKNDYSTTFSSRSEAKKAEVRMIRRVEAGRDLSNKITLQAAYDLWLSTVKRNVAERTADAYVYNWKKYCKPMADMVVQRIQPIDIVKWRSGLEADYSPETINKSLSLISMVLDFCRDVLRVIEVSPAEHVPRCKIQQTVHPTWTEEEIHSFLAFIKDSLYYAPIALICVTGMRPGECCGLMEDDLSLSGSLSLHQGRNAKGNTTRMKTERSHRTIKLTSEISGILRDYIHEKHMVGCMKKELFVSADFQPLRPDVLSRHFRSLLRSYNKTTKTQLPEIRLYDIRHSFATNCLMDGAKSKLVSEVMGNSVNTMEHHYAHLRETMHEELISGYAEKII